MKNFKISALLVLASVSAAFAQEDVALAETGIKSDRNIVSERRINKLDPSGYKYEVKNLKVNSEFSDLTNQFYKEKFIYSSAKKIGLFKSTIDPQTNEAYKELFCGNIDKNQEIIHSTFFSNVLNSQDNNETYVSFTGDNQTVYFTRSVKEGDKEPLKIFRAVLSDKYENWVNVEMLSFNMEGFEYDTPYISKDGRHLYFASNMPGTLGGMDIFVVNINADGTTSTPRNLGNEINTTKDEKYPYMIDGEALYYSSQGHYGMGGYDIFESKYVNGKFHFPTNMGSSINSIADDFGFLINKDNAGYFTSNRDGGKGGYDIYAFEREKVKQFIDIKVLDDNGEPIANTNIVIKDAYNRVYKNAATNEIGDLKVEVLPYNSYAIYIEKDGYDQSIIGFESLKGEVKDYVYNENVTLNKKIVRENLFTQNNSQPLAFDAEVLFDTDKWDLNTEALANVVNKLNSGISVDEIIINAHADFRNSEAYNLKLSQKRGMVVLDYLVANTNIDAKLFHVTFYGENDPKVNCDNCTEDQLHHNRRVQVIVKESNSQLAQK